MAFCKRLLELESRRVQEDTSPMTGITQGLGRTNLHSPYVTGESPVRINPGNISNRLMKNGMKVSTTPVGVSSRFRPRRILSEDENFPPSSPSKFSILRQRGRTPLEDQDPNSQDSGYGVSEDSKSPASFRFAQPCGKAPRRLGSIESPRRNLLATSFTSCSSSSSNNSLDDDGFLDLYQIDKPMDTDSSSLPQGLGSLLSGTILGSKPTNISSDHAQRPLFRRCLSENVPFWPKRPLSELDNQPQAKKMRMSWDSGKRCNVVPVRSKSPEKKRGTLFQYGFTKRPLSSSQPTASPILHPTDRNLSIKRALQRSDTQEDLTGDFTRPCALPLMSGKHQDLKTISSETLAKLINGHYSDRIVSYKIIDCRYPYEYEGGHIKGAVNLYTPEQIKMELIGKSVENPTTHGSNGDSPRNILVFHCEFSSERGPSMSRYLRQEDRRGNEYPWLRYPELYLLHGGYQAFYQGHSSLCRPQAYKPMTHPAHASDLKNFRAKSKSWAGPKVSRSLSRLGF